MPGRLAGPGFVDTHIHGFGGHATTDASPEERRMSHDIKLVLTDIDGTILPHGWREVSERTVRALEAARAAGMVEGPASGRAQKWIAPMLRGRDDLCATALATNGMQVYLEGELLHEEVIDPAQLELLDAAMRELPRAGLVCFDDGKPQLVCGSLDDLAQCFPSYAKTCRVLDHLPQTPTVKCNVFQVGDLDATRAFVAKLNDAFPALSFDVPQTAWSNVTPRGWTKGSGIDILRDALGINRDQVVVFGDAGNDVPMFTHVDWSVAVAGATDEASAAARFHIGRCEDDAVAVAIEALVAGEWPFT